MCIIPYHLLAFLLDATKTQHYGNKQREKKPLRIHSSDLLQLIIELLIKSEAFNDIMFLKTLFKNVRTLVLWKSQRNSASIDKEFPTIEQLL